MSYQERRALVSLISNIGLVVLYSTYMVQRYPEADVYSPEIFKFWGSFFLLLIPVAIVSKIIIIIMFTIINAIATREVEQPITDERDKLIESKAQTNANNVFVVGFILSMGSLVIEMSPNIMFVILFCSGVISEMISEISQFYYYRRGF